MELDAFDRELVWRTPMTSPSAVRDVTVERVGDVVAASEW